MPVTIKDIADICKVSTTTVSQILNGKGQRFSQEITALVQQTAQNLNYTPNKLASGLITGKSMALGLIVPDIRNPYFSNLAHSISLKATNSGYNVLLSNSSDLQSNDLSLIRQMHAQHVDGLIYCLAGNSTAKTFNESLQTLISTGLPFVLVDRTLPYEGHFTHIKLDHFKGGYMATAHLLESGHKHIACICGPLALQDAEDRVSGYKQALLDYGQQFDADLVRMGAYQELPAFHVAKILLKEHTEITGIFACNDLMALGVMQACNELGLNIPQDISLVGYDDISLASLSLINLTTIRQPIDRLGSLAVSKLLEKFTANINTSTIQTSKEAPDNLVPELIIRGSTRSI